MRTHNLGVPQTLFKPVVFLIAISSWGILSSAGAFANTVGTVASEISGVESAVPATLHDVVVHRAAIPAAGLLLIPDSTSKRVMAFDPGTGDLVNADYIPSDPSHFSTPLKAVLKPDGSGFLVSDQVRDVEQEYELNGAYLRVFAPAGGVNTSIRDNISSDTFREKGQSAGYRSEWRQYPL